MMSLEQKRAKDAWDKSASYGEQEINLAKGLPALIMNSGLMQTVAFLESKKDDHYKKVSNDLRQWLHCRFDSIPIPEEFHDFMVTLSSEIDSQTYQAMTSEAMAWLKWLRYLSAARTSYDSQQTTLEKQR